MKGESRLREKADEGRGISVCYIYCTEYGGIKVQVMVQKEEFKAISLIVTFLYTYYLKCQ